MCLCVREVLRGVPARQNVGGLGVPAGEPAATGMWKKEGVGWAFSPVRGSQRAPQLSEQQLVYKRQGVCMRI